MFNIVLFFFCGISDVFFVFCACGFSAACVAGVSGEFSASSSRHAADASCVSSGTSGASDTFSACGVFCGDLQLHRVNTSIYFSRTHPRAAAPHDWIYLKLSFDHECAHALRQLVLPVLGVFVVWAHHTRRGQDGRAQETFYGSRAWDPVRLVWAAEIPAR